VSPDYPLDHEPATPEYVLDVLRVTAPDLDWDSSATALACWYNDLAWPTPRLLGECLNATFRIELPPDVWRRAFPTLRGRTVREVCEFVARHVTRPVVRPWLACAPAGAFLTIRAVLAGRGVDPDHLSPSARPDALPHADLESLFWRLTLIAPGRVPPPRRRGSVGYYLVCLLGVGWLLLGTSLGLILVVLGVTTGSVTATAVGVAMVATGVASGWAAGRVRRPPFVRSEWDRFPTFRDLAYALAGQQPRRRVQHSP
jgi:hypothetical protein